MLYPINSTRLHYVETGQFIKQLITDFENSKHIATEDPDFNKLFESLKVQSALYVKALMPIKAQAESSEILVLDSKRDKKAVTLRTALSVFQYDDQPEIAAAFKLVSVAIKKYKGLEKMNFEAETLAIDNLVRQLDVPEYASAVQILSLNYRIDDLKEGNDAFKALFNSRSTAMIKKETFDTKQIKSELLQIYNELAEYVDVMAKIKKTDFFKETLVVINYSRTYFATILANRQGRS